MERPRWFIFLAYLAIAIINLGLAIWDMRHNLWGAALFSFGISMAFLAFSIEFVQNHLMPHKVSGGQRKSDDDSCKLSR